MTKINHTRPELKYRNNLRRELSRIVEIWPDKSDTADAPAILKPFITTPSTLQALGRVLEEFIKYLDEPREFYSMTPSADAVALRQVCERFGKAKMNDPYDHLYTVHDWLKKAVANRSTSDPFYKWLLQIVEAA